MAANYTSDQIVKILLSGQVTPEMFSSLQISPKRVLAALLKNPEAIASLQKSGGQAVEPLTSFDPSQVYDPDSAINTVAFKYAQMGPKYSQLVQDFWNTVAQTGNSPDFETYYKDLALTNPKASAEKYGLAENEFSTVVDAMNKDRQKFMTAETARQKSQMAAFLKQRKSKGITAGVGQGQELNQYLQATTGVGGLADVATSLEDFSKKKSEDFKKSLIAKGFSAPRADVLSQDFSKKLLSKAKKQKVNPIAFSAQDLVRKTLLGG